MKRKLIAFIIIAVFAASYTAYSQSQGIRVAVARFNDSLTRETESQNAGASLSSALEREYAAAGQFQLRPSGAIAGYLDNLRRVQLGLSDDIAIRGKSKDLRVDYLVVGTVTRLGDSYNVDTRIVNVDTWKILKSHGVTCASAGDAVPGTVFALVKHFDASYLKDREDDSMELPTVAVFGFRDENPAAMRTRFSTVFTEMFNSVLGSFRLVDTVERTYTKTLMDEKVLEMVGVLENEGVRKNRDVMNIQYRLVGGFRVFRDVTTVNYRIENMSTGRTVFMGSRDIGSSAALRPVCEAISIQVEDALHNRIGTLKLDSDPAGADVLIDDEPAGKAPLIAPISGGTHSVVVKMEGYETQTISLQAEARSVIERKVKLEKVSLKLMNDALVFERRGRYADALRCYNDFLAKYGDTVNAEQALYRKGHLELVYMKNPAQSVRTFETLAGRYPGAEIRAEAYYGIVKAHAAAGNREKALHIRDYMVRHYGDTIAAEEVRAMSL